MREGCGWEVSYRVEVSLVKLVHSSLQLAALALPLLKIADRFHGGTLPCGGASIVIHIIDPSPVIHSALPTGTVKEMDSTISKQTVRMTCPRYNSQLCRMKFK